MLITKWVLITSLLGGGVFQRTVGELDEYSACSTDFDQIASYLLTDHDLMILVGRDPVAFITPDGSNMIGSFGYLKGSDIFCAVWLQEKKK